MKFIPTFFSCSARLQQYHLPSHCVLDLGSLVLDVLHRNRKDSLNSRHARPPSCLLYPRLPHLPIHRIIPQV